jgi:GTPase SAR1 family protein
MYDSIGGNYIKNADGAFILYDISNQVRIQIKKDLIFKESFFNVQHWQEKVFDYGPQDKDIAMMLIGHKSDLSLSREVQYDVAKVDREFYLLTFDRNLQTTTDWNISK